MIYKNVLELIGNTSVLELQNFNTGKSKIFMKLENQNPGGSIKDRIGLSMIEHAEKEGKIKPGDTLIEATAGNTRLENCMAELENGKAAFAFSSGLAAENTILEMLEPGSHIIAMEDLYGGTFRLFEKVKKISANLETSFIDLNDEEKLVASIKSNTKLI